MTKTLNAVIFSDLHLSYNGPLDYKLDFPDDTNVVIVAGDITDPVGESIYWLEKNVATADRPVIFVAGNHEHYGQYYDESMQSGYSASEHCKNVHFLENTAVTIEGVRFLGCTLWTDHNLYENIKKACQHAILMLNDYRMIQIHDENGHPARWTPEHTMMIHKESREWLESELAKPFDGKTVVVTHHCPHNMSIGLKYAGDQLNPAFTSDLSEIITRYEPDLWIHGHTHSNFNYVVPGTKTRVICNPRGYVRKTFGGRDIENTDFTPMLSVAI